jgi:hypothetical protein
MGFLGPLVTSLTAGVQYVVSIGTQEQMSGPNAGRIVTLVADQHPLRDLPLGKGEGIAVSFPCHPVDIEIPIAPVVKGAGPEPTCGGFSNLLPEPGLRGTLQ